MGALSVGATVHLHLQEAEIDPELQLSAIEPGTFRTLIDPNSCSQSFSSVFKSRLITGKQSRPSLLCQRGRVTLRRPVSKIKHDDDGASPSTPPLNRYPGLRQGGRKLEASPNRGTGD
jgi:hypothetical protein